MRDYKLGGHSLPFRTSSRSGNTTILPLRRSTRPKKPPMRFSSTRMQMENIIHTEIGDKEKAEEDNQSSAKIKLIRKMGKWVMHDEYGGNKSKRFKSNRHGEGKTNRHGEGKTNRHGKGEANRRREGEASRAREGEANRHEGKNNNYKGNGHAGAPSDKNVNNNSNENKKGRNSNSEVNVNLKKILEEFNSIHCEQVPFCKRVPPVPAEETVCEELRQPSPERFVTYLDRDYAIPRTSTPIIGEIPAGELKMNGTEMKQEIEDLAELELQDDDEVEIIGEIPAGVLKNINENVKKEDTEDLAEACIPQSASREAEPQNVDEIGDFAEASISSVTNEELSTTKSMNKHANVAQNIIKGGCYLNEVTGCFQNIVKEESEPENKDEEQIVCETVVQNVINTESMQTLEYPDEIVKSGSLGEDEAVDSSQVGKHGRHNVDKVGEHRRQGVDEAREHRGHGVDEAREHRGHGVDEESGEHKRHSVGETGEHSRRQGIEEAREHRRHGVDEAREHRQHGVDEAREHRRHGVDEAREHRRHGVDEAREHRRHGVDEAREHRRPGVDEAREHRRHGVDEAGEYRRHGVDESREHKRYGVDEQRDHRGPDVDEVGEQRRQGVDEAREQRRQGVDEAREQWRQGVDEAREQLRQGVDEVRGHRQQDMGCCGACRRNDKIKIKMEIEMSTEQFLQVAKEMPNIVTDVNVHSS